MPVDIEGKGNGWACTCRAFRLGEPGDAEAARAVARSAGVTVQALGGGRFLAWSDPASKHNVSFGAGPGGWCKHVAACAAEFLPWLPAAARGVAAALGELEAAQKELKVGRRKSKSG